MKMIGSWPRGKTLPGPPRQWTELHPGGCEDCSTGSRKSMGTSPFTSLKTEQGWQIDHVCYSFSQKRHLFWTNSLMNAWPFSFPLSPWTNYSKRLRWCNILVNKTKKLIFRKHYNANCSTLNRCILYSECTKELLKIKSKFWTLCCLTLERISKETDIKCMDNK